MIAVLWVWDVTPFPPAVDAVFSAMVFLSALLVAEPLLVRWDEGLQRFWLRRRSKKDS